MNNDIPAIRTNSDLKNTKQRTVDMKAAIPLKNCTCTDNIININSLEVMQVNFLERKNVPLKQIKSFGNHRKI